MFHSGVREGKEVGRSQTHLLTPTTAALLLLTLVQDSKIMCEEQLPATRRVKPHWAPRLLRLSGVHVPLSLDSENQIWLPLSRVPVL